MATTQDTRIIVPYTRLDPAVVNALETHGTSQIEYYNLNGSEEMYFQLLSQVWDEGETFILVEHDIVIAPDSVQRFIDCPRTWCASAYRYCDGMISGLGCARFDAALIRRHPRTLQHVGTMGDELHPLRHWCRLDAWLQQTLRNYGEQVCVEHGTVEHIGDVWPSHGCITKPS